VQLKDISKEKRRGKFTKGVLFLHDKALAHGALTIQKKLAYLGFQCLDHQPHSPNLVRRTTTCSLDWKNNWKISSFRPTRRSLLPSWPAWTIKFLIFFLSGFQKLEQRAKKCIELRGEHVEKIPSLVAVACFLSGRAKDLSAPLIFYCMLLWP